jgi:hypothetical protein
MKELLLKLEYMACCDVQEKTAKAVGKVREALSELGCNRGPKSDNWFSFEERAALEAMLSEDPRRSMPAFLWERSRLELLNNSAKGRAFCPDSQSLIPPGAVEVSAMINFEEVKGYVIDVLGNKMAFVTEVKGMLPLSSMSDMESALLKAYADYPI